MLTYGVEFDAELQPQTMLELHLLLSRRLELPSTTLRMGLSLLLVLLYVRAVLL